MQQALTGQTDAMYLQKQERQTGFPNQLKKCLPLLSCPMQMKKKKGNSKRILITTINLYPFKILTIPFFW